MTGEKKSSGMTKKIIIALVIVLILSLGLTGVFYYIRYYGPNVTNKQEYLYIHTGATYADVYKTIQDEGIVKDTAAFNVSAHNMRYINRVKPGRYHLHPGMGNRRLINMLASGSQEPIQLSFHNLRLKEDFAGFVSKKIEPDSVSILRLLDSDQFLQQYGFTRDNVYAVFIPNTYQLYWNTTPEKFFKRMYANYEKFWTPERKQQAKEINLTPVEVSVLASVVDAEALHDDEMPTIAGLYLNRLKKGMKLESDPTVIFALHDFTIRRVLNRYLSYNSPYNTYLHTGLPPGPIMMPSVNALDAVLNYKKTDYIYMCAKEDFSGYHNFATNQADHLINARKFQQALNERNIKK
ncbi:endolytic transglycosylase MltG [Mucilaginibacter ginsenosidivorans]|uniref:Endolytic murein transglycosylase n=1 Tax=Mucilaginibacter ginsenosidivorans TaxID=398053 RepID=A0A5B8UYP4_9SPHI|nr:endolytic transglycosylase MltG [Mucilaginibacter ginsenosidivorans]QEC64327.1 endolytic transglycosylase MltG [Mucilaginibacter ginsenosidivorans]